MSVEHIVSSDKIYSNSLTIGLTLEGLQDFIDEALAEGVNVNAKVRIRREAHGGYDILQVTQR